MSKQEKKGLVPALRFPEFRVKGGWKNTQLGKLGDFTGGGTPTKSNDSYWQGNIPWISSSDIYEDSIHEFNISRYISEEALNDSATKLVPKNSVLLVSRVGVGKLAISKKSVCTSQDFTNFTPAKDDLVFLGYYLKSRNKALIEYSQGMAIKGFTKDDVAKLDVYIPSPEEQQKVADCLTSVDELITAQTQKLDALKTHKKGLMQQLFPAEGETVPQLRFPEFRDKGEWEDTTIGGIGSFYYGKSAPKWSLEDDAPTRCVRYGELYTKFGVVINETYSRTNIDPNNLRFSKGGEILVPRVGEKPEDFGKCCCYLPLGNIAIGEMISVFETVQNPLFYTYYFRHLYREFAKVVEGQNVKNLYYAVLEPLPIQRPSLPEQQKIADCLTSVDELITAQTQKLDALKTHKKGLMQQLFPAMNAENV